LERPLNSYSGFLTAEQILIYTDGSCNTEYCVGGWAAIIFVNGEKVALEGYEEDTTHQRMELTAVIQALEYIRRNKVASSITVYTDSQYVKGLILRREKLQHRNFTTKKKTDLPNTDLLRIIFQQLEQLVVTFIKVKAHEKISDQENYNHEVDKRSRKIVRARCLEIKSKTDIV
jgi:ribonuclease HI